MKPREFWGVWHLGLEWPMLHATEKSAREACRGVFEKAWSDEDALAEKDALFGSLPTDDCAIVCDDCFKQMGFV